MTQLSGGTGLAAMTMVIKFLPTRAGLAVVGYIGAVEDDLNLPIRARAISQDANCVTLFSTTPIRAQAEFSGSVVQTGDRRGVV